MRDLTKRLAKLEAVMTKNGDAPLPAGPFSPGLFQSAILAVHRGGYQEGEAIAEAHARALGLSWQEYRQSFADGRWLERHNQAWTDFCASKGFDLGVADSLAQIKFMDDVLQDVPDHIRRTLWLDGGAADAFV